MSKSLRTKMCILTLTFTLNYFNSSSEIIYLGEDKMSKNYLKQETKF